jgi:RimJ/RimL family protein N-acetyltransferase
MEGCKNKNFMYIHKNGICLRKIEKHDLPKLKELKNESWFGTHHFTFLNDYDQEKWFEGLNRNTHLILIAIDTKTNNEVGVYKFQNIDWYNRKYDSSHDVFKEYRGMGYSKPVLCAGTDFAFEIMNMNRIDGEVLENNEASMKSAIYAGFTKEGIRRKSIYKCGEYLDSIHIGLLREDWIELNRIKEYNGVCNISYKPKNN